MFRKDILHYEDQSMYIGSDLIISYCAARVDFANDIDNDLRYTRKILEVTCKRCLAMFAKKAGLKKGTPIDILYDYIQENGITL